MLSDPHMAAARESDRPVLVPARVVEDAIVCDRPPGEITALLENGQVVILKNVFSAGELLAYRNAVVRWRDSTEPFPNGRRPDDFPALNYHRADTKAFLPAMSIKHIFRQFGFNTPEDLPDYLGGETLRIAGLLIGLQNAVAGTRFDLSPTGMRVKILHYPSGEGHLEKHDHPLLPQRVGLILSLSRIGMDCASGATAIQLPTDPPRWLDTARHHDIGDIILFRYDLPHEVSLVDEGTAADWQSDAGKWSFVLELRDTFSKSQTS